jgi:hypothetical protein
MPFVVLWLDTAQVRRRALPTALENLRLLKPYSVASQPPAQARSATRLSVQ